ncbi:hypothetical protein N656DRAFT_847874 [Canariomyces notabilis]|uniref:F-box domain-containing protein n=1 Tax=Canariomyces notabilis TaxID=2074819 RepID=A0AAN6QGK1_9PEZI|nr:hypothetical protein N656DRAFT_847874 [Canariomyces arenarius]
MAQANIPLPSPLISLPSEVLDEIIQALVNANDGRAGLASLARTCRYMHNRLTPVLYGKIEDPRIHSVVGDEVVVSNRPRLNYLALAHTIALSRRLRQHITVLKFGNAHLSPEVLINAPQGPGRDAMLLFIQHRLRLNILNPDEDLSSPIPALALCAVAVNLGRLVLTSTSHRSWIGTDFLLIRDADAPEQHYPWGSRQVNIKILDGLLRASPILETLSIERPSSGAELTTQLHNLTSVKLTTAWISERGLIKLLRAARHLNRFEYSINPHGETHIMPVSPRGILRALAPASQTLQRLYIASYIQPNLIPANHEYPLIETLAGFPALREVALDYRCVDRDYNGGPAMVLLFVGCPLIERIYLFDIEHMLPWEFQGFVTRVKQTHWLHLKTVKLMGDYVSDFQLYFGSSLEFMQAHEEMERTMYVKVIILHERDERYVGPGIED